MTTLAVLWPTPAKDSRKSQSGYISPPESMICSAIFLRFFAFVGAKPISLIRDLISSTSSSAIFSGESAISNNAGVTSFTFLSVVWAESITATSKV